MLSGDGEEKMTTFGTGICIVLTLLGHWPEFIADGTCTCKIMEE